MTPETPPFPYAGELAAACSALFWGSSGIIFAKLPPISPAAMNLGKNIVGAVCFAVLLLATTGAPWPVWLPREALLWFSLSGLAGLTLCDTLLLRSLRAIGPQRMSLVMTLHPVLVAIGAMFPPFNEFPPALAWVGMAVCLGGIGLAVLEKPARPIDPRDASGGLRDAALAAVFQAVGILLARYGQSRWPGSAADGAMVRMVAGLAGIVLIGLPALRILTWGRSLVNRKVAWWIFIASFFGTFLGIWLNQLGLAWAEHTGVATTLNALSPIYLIPLTAIFLHERHTRRGWIATVVAIAGIALMAAAR